MKPRRPSPRARNPEGGSRPEAPLRPLRSRRARGPWLGSLRTRLVVTFVLVTLTGSATATVLAYREARTAILKRAQDSFQDNVHDRVTTLAPDVDLPPTARGLTELAERVSQSLDGAPLVVTRYRELQGSSDRLADSSRITPELREAVRTRSAMSFQRVTHRDTPYLVVGTPVTFGDDGRASGLEVYAVTSLRPEQDDTGALLTAVRDGVAPVVLLSALLALLSARAVLRPVRDLGRATRKLAEGDLSIRVAVKGRDELANLAQDFNETADELQSSVTHLRDQEERARRFVADVSHELRTPLAAMTMVATVLEEDADQLPPDTAQAARTVSAETAKLSRLVDDLMEMSRFDSGAARLTLTDTDVAEAIRASLALRGWTDAVRTELPEGVRAPLDRRRLDVIIANLVGNALHHGAPPVTLTLTSTPTPTGRTAVVTVTDQGPGLSPEALTRVFDRFYKADAARTRSEGSGLGTAISLENARLHGGTIEATNAPEGGAVFTLSLPLPLSETEAKAPTA
ncbi:MULTISPECIES: ATP-binding protein [unclassified Streptomyces]|uniref:ATP-binding protein n=1 Tax=unclassified Streptomyces TaxID=2593676 RepID=UPI002E3219B7|nr:ATP-binding protein [Streptomyces sp. NBC_01268]